MVTADLKQKILKIFVRPHPLNSFPKLCRQTLCLIPLVCHNAVLSNPFQDDIYFPNALCKFHCEFCENKHLVIGQLKENK